MEGCDHSWHRAGGSEILFVPIAYCSKPTHLKSLPCHFLYCKIALINLVRRGLRFLDLFSVEKEGMFIYFYIEHIFNGLLDGFDTRVTKF